METIFKTIAKKLNKNLLNEISEKIFNQDIVTDFIIKGIQDRLYTTGTDADNKRLRTNRALKGYTNLGFYSKRTEKIKGGKNIDRVTLNDTGNFYKSWEVAANKTFYNLKANFNKSDGNIQENFSMSYSGSEFENAILRMNDNEQSLFIKQMFIPYMQQNLKLKLWNTIKTSR